MLCYKLLPGDRVTVDSADFLPGFVRGTKHQTLTATGGEGGVVAWDLRLVVLGGVCIPFERVVTLRLYGEIIPDTGTEAQAASEAGANSGGQTIRGQVPEQAVRPAAPSATCQVEQDPGLLRPKAGNRPAPGKSKVPGRNA